MFSEAYPVFPDHCPPPWFRCLIIFFLTTTTHFSMCNSKIKMVTPTKSKHYHKAAPGRQQQAKTPLKSGGSRNRTTPSPPTSVDLSFKTPQKPYHSMPRAELMQQQRCKSEPKTSRGRSVTPPTFSSSSPLTFAGPKCLEPPTPTSLPRPPTTWTRSDLYSCPARQALSFDDLVEIPKRVETIDDPLSQQLKMLLKVQA